MAAEDRRLWVCDRCGQRKAVPHRSLAEERPRPPKWGTLSVEGVAITTKDGKSVGEAWDLCDRCASDLTYWARTVVRGGADEKETIRGT